MKEEYAVFKVPAEIFEDPELRSKLCTLVKELLTLGRSNMKQKVSQRHSLHFRGETTHPLDLFVVRDCQEGAQYQ
jgi:hypothetical protein